MLRKDTDGEARFRAEVRAWMEANLPANLRSLSHRATPTEVLVWHKLLYERGWAAPHWPREWGGMEAGAVQQIIFLEEAVRVGAPELGGHGLNHLGPMLLKCGTEAQKRQHLPAILKGDAYWAQGYSEPGAGSDLFSLRTKGVVDGDSLVINGQKTWTSGAHYAHWMFALVRTGDGGKSRRESITFILIDTATPGITRRPIRTLTGDPELCEVFVDDARVPLTNIVGEINAGWKVANAVLREQRARSGSPVQALKALKQLRAVARHTGADRDPWYQERIARAEIEVMALEACYLDGLERLEAELDEVEDTSYMKLLGSETVQYVTNILQEIAGPRAAFESPRVTDDEHPDFSRVVMQSRRYTLMGGTSEIQRTLIANGVLGLPRPGHA